MKFVNNPELSDVIFKVEGRLFYAHKIILVTASPRFQKLLRSKLCEKGIPTIQIYDIRYQIFQVKNNDFMCFILIINSSYSS